MHWKVEFPGQTWTHKQTNKLQQNNSKFEREKGKSPSRSASSANQNQEESLKQQTKQIKKDVQHPKCKFNIKKANNNPSLKKQRNNKHFQKIYRWSPTTKETSNKTWK